MLSEDIKRLSAEMHQDLVGIRRHLHANPELSFFEHRTSAFLKDVLSQRGISWEPIADTGVMGIVEGKDPTSRTIAIRADIDALPIQELNQVDYISRHPGVMHACGHDFHTASLLGTIAVLNAIKDRFSGTVKFLFQPAEEVLPGGAIRMIHEGALMNPTPEAIIGQHAMPSIPAGKIAIRKGKFMASMDALHVRVTGKGGHAAEPHNVIDPVLIASHIIVALQQVVSRRSNPREPVVLSFGKVRAEGAVNVIPDEVTMEGTFRALNEEWRERAHQLMRQMAAHIASAMGGSCEFNITRGYPFLSNDENLASALREDAIEYLGASNVLDQDIWMAAEDFAYYAQAIPGCFYLCGVGNEARGITSALHTPTFDIDEQALLTSAGLMAYFAIKRLGS